MNIEITVKNTLKKIDKKVKILVALSGGKDSITTAYLLKKFGYNISGIHLDLKMGEYSDRCLSTSKEICALLNIPLKVFDIKKEFGSSMCYLRSKIQEKNPGKIKNCAICGVIKKWVLNKIARREHADFIATGHNLDDECQTFLINLFKGSPSLSSNLGFITKNKADKKFIPRLKPLYYIPEKEIRKYALQNKLPFVAEKCPCAIDSYRIQLRNFLENEESNKKINILRNIEKIYSKKWKKAPSNGPNYCKICGEPSREEVCRVCQLMKSCCN